MKKILFTAGVIIFIGFGIYAISKTAQKSKIVSKKITVVTTLFPLYDFTKTIGGDKVDAILLLPPGVEPHAYEPKPSDITKINNAKLFVYTGEFMEPWAYDIIESANKTVKVVDASLGIDLMKKVENDEQEHSYSGVDPHIWLDFDNAKIMAENITKALTEVDSQNTKYYENNLIDYKTRFNELDETYKKTLSSCKSETIIYGGHYAFGYLAKRYELNYKSAQGFSPDAEPTAKDMIALVDQINDDNIKYIFYEELTSPKIAETISNETNTKLLLLNGAHNLTKEDYETGITFISIMKKNLSNISLGLDCNSKVNDDVQCSQFEPDSCPKRCVVCPPCPQCSSIVCQSKSFCANMNFDETWYRDIKKRLEQIPNNN